MKHLLPFAFIACFLSASALMLAKAWVLVRKSSENNPFKR